MNWRRRRVIYRLSDVDIDLIALAISNQTTLVTDDYRMKNVARKLELRFKVF